MYCKYTEYVYTYKYIYIYSVYMYIACTYTYSCRERYIYIYIYVCVYIWQYSKHINIYMFFFIIYFNYCTYFGTSRHPAIQPPFFCTLPPFPLALHGGSRTTHSHRWFEALPCKSENIELLWALCGPVLASSLAAIHADVPWNASQPWL